MTLQTNTSKKQKARRVAMPSLTPTRQDFEFLDSAVEFFANPGLIAKGLAWSEKPVESFQNRIPEKVRNAVSSITERAVHKAMLAALKTLPDEKIKSPAVGHEANRAREVRSQNSSRLHRGLTAASGVAGGMFGIPSLAIELPITTVLILRGILDQARLYGHDMSDIQIRLECLMIFTMGTVNHDENSISRYFMTRASFVGILREAAAVAGAFTTKGLTSGPVLTRLVAKVADKLQVRVSQKFVAESVPIIGALGGGALNYAFTDFFVTAAHYHFGIRALEKKYGETVIQNYLKVSEANVERDRRH